MIRPAPPFFFFGLAAVGCGENPARGPPGGTAPCCCGPGPPCAPGPKPPGWLPWLANEGGGCDAAAPKPAPGWLGAFPSEGGGWEGVKLAPGWLGALPNDGGGCEAGPAGGCEGGLTCGCALVGGKLRGAGST